MAMPDVVKEFEEKYPGYYDYIADIVESIPESDLLLFVATVAYEAYRQTIPNPSEEVNK